MEKNICWEQISKSLRKYIARHINNSDVEDVLQEVLLKIYNNIDGLRDNTKLNLWVYKISQNAVIDYYRNKNKEMLELTDNLFQEDFEEDSYNNEISKCLNTMIEYLPEKYKEVIKLIEYNGLTQKEVSQQLGISVSAVKSRVFRARGMLKQMLIECCYFELDRLGNIIDYKHKTTNCKFC
ncbi:RNA polymerase sigma factor [Fervidicella metallireducens AeB]|uniref:RNA polymerase sigma factor SigZ n=1 Tax=Fervidicella metallireducens AeB TaxID=1403537 RepID=A0A017RSC2_9CLOT|nr:RNA polymerase sigma factor SigZ [Fervidicella metallireducens]EYE87522.1 RNA polymerase sigma factor [Fervidicella metallireducens AeB]